MNQPTLAGRGKAKGLPSTPSQITQSQPVPVSGRVSRSISSTGTTTRTRRRVTKGKLRRNNNVDCVIDEPFTFSLSQEHMKLMEQLSLQTEDSMSREVGDGCYVSCTVHRRRYYGVLVDQNALKAANALYFKDEADSLNLNRKMMILSKKQHEKFFEKDGSEGEKKINVDDSGSSGKKRAIDLDVDASGSLVNGEKRARKEKETVRELGSSTEPNLEIHGQNIARDGVKPNDSLEREGIDKITSTMFCNASEEEKKAWADGATDKAARSLKEHAVVAPVERTVQSERESESDRDRNPKPPRSTVSAEHAKKQVQKLVYVPPDTAGECSGPGYRRLLATYENVYAAAEDRIEKVDKIYAACLSGGDFVGKYYYQFQIPPSTLFSQQGFESGHADDSMNFDIRTSLSLNAFLQNTRLPPWYPLSNLEGFSQAKVLSILQMKKSAKGGLDWNNDNASSETNIYSSPQSRVPLPIPPRMTFRVGVLGGGISGLACAAELLRLAEGRDELLDIEVIVLEGRSRVGGRLDTDTKSFKTSDGKPFPVDLGAAWIHGVDGNPLTDLAKEAGVRLLPSSEEVKMLTSNMNEVDKDTDKKMYDLFDDLLDQAAVDCWEKAEPALVDDKIRHQRANRWYASILPPKDLQKSASNVSVEPISTDIPIHRYSTDIAVDHAIGIALSKKQNVQLSAEEQSLLFWHTKNTEYALGANISDLSMKYWDSDEHHAFEGEHVLLKQGYARIAEHLLKRCQRRKHFKVIFNFSIGKIEYSRASCSLPPPKKHERTHKVIELSDTCRVSSRDGKSSYNFDFVVCTLPLGILKNSADAVPYHKKKEQDQDPQTNGKVIFDPPLPHTKRDAIDAVGFGLLNKIYLQFPCAFWRKLGPKDMQKGTPFLGDGQYVFGNASGTNPHHYMFHDVGRCLSDPSDSNPPAILSTLVSGVEAVRLEHFSTDYVVKEVMETLKTIFSNVDVPSPVKVTATRWGSDEFARGCYTFLPPGATDEDYSALQSPINGNGDSLFLSEDETMRLFWAGEHTTSLHPSMAHGALLSGIRAAEEVIAATHFKSREHISDLDRPIPVSVYRSKHPTAPVMCHFCQKPGSRKKEGALFALQRGTRQVLIHFHCAQYSPEVEAVDGSWKNVIKAVYRGKQIKCILCKKSGGTIGCQAASCSRTYHFTCGEETGWSFERDGKEFLCALHRQSDTQEPQKGKRLTQKDKRVVDYAIDIALFRRMSPSTPMICQLCNTMTGEKDQLIAFYQRENNRHALVHKDCAQHSDGVDIIDGSWTEGRGLFINVIDSVVKAKQRSCSHCGQSGSSVSCFHRSCEASFHVPCAREIGWRSLGREMKSHNFYCPKHSSQSRASRTAPQSIVGKPSNKKIRHALFESSTPVVNDGSDLILESASAFVDGSNSSSSQCNKASDESFKRLGTQTSPVQAKPAKVGCKVSSAPAAAERKEVSAKLEGSKENEKGAKCETKKKDTQYHDQQDDINNGSADKARDMAVPFVVDPQLKDPEIGAVYTEQYEIEAKRKSTREPWNLQVMIDQETKLGTTTLRVYGRLAEELGPYRLRKGDIIVSVNGIKLGSVGLLNLEQFAAVMNASVEVKFGVLRKPS